MRTNRDPRPADGPASAIDLPIGSVALRRLVGEVGRPGHGPDATLYNRTYHRHNR